MFVVTKRPRRSGGARLAWVVAWASVGALGCSAAPLARPDGGDAAAAAPRPSSDAAAPDGAAGAVARLVIDDFEGTSAGFLWTAMAGAAPGAAASPLAPSPLAPARGASRFGLHIADHRSSAGGSLRAHHHVGLSPDATVIFWARTALGNPERLVFAVTGEEREGFWAAQSAGRAWHARELIVPTAWTEFRIPLRELAPMGPGTPRPLSSPTFVMLHFVTHLETFDFWIDDVSVECPGRCF